MEKGRMFGSPTKGSVMKGQSVMTDSAGFTHLSTSQSSSRTSDSSSSNIEFQNMKTLYSLEKDFICTFSVSAPFKINEGDSIAICSSKDKLPPDIFTKVPVNPNVFVGDGVKYYIVTFKVKDLPQDWNWYKLCYTSNNEVIAASAPFRFGYPGESEFIEVEDPHDPGLVVFKSRVAESNEAIAKLKEEKSELLTKCQVNEESISLLRKEVDKLETALNHLQSRNRSLNDANKSMKEELSKRQIETLPNLFHNMTLAPAAQDFSSITSGINEVKQIVSNIQSSLPEKEDLTTIREAVDNITSSLNDLKKTLSPPKVELNPDRKVCPTWLTSSTESNLATDEIEEEADFSSAETEAVPEESTNHQSSSTVSENPKIEVQDCLSKIMKENEALCQELREVKEINAFLRSRVGVLELEVCNMNEKKYQLLMNCITAYEQENATLKEELEKMTKDVCEKASLLKQIDMLTLENTTLKTHIRRGTPTIDPLVKGLQDDLNRILLEKENLKHQLMELRKQTVGKISLHCSGDSSSSASSGI